MRFLISNDDGVNAPGLLALYEALSKVGEVVVVAPDTEQSGCASALHISQPLYTHKLTSGFIAVNGTPADCIYLALHELYRDSEFDCVITGINAGANVGQDVLFSGTFGAALTAQLFGIPAIATSLVGGVLQSNYPDDLNRYAMAAEEVIKLLTETSILKVCKSLPYHVLNVNIPNVSSAEKIKGRKITCLAHDRIARPVHRVTDPRGREAYWLSLRKNNVLGVETSAIVDPKLLSSETALEGSTSAIQRLNNDGVVAHDTDSEVVAAGYISLSPVKLHHTPVTALDKLSALEW